MVLVEIEGGLGNQMFQYAAGKALSTRLGVPLLLSSHVFRSFPKKLLSDSFFPLASYSVFTSLQKTSFAESTYKNRIKKLLGFPFRKVYKEENLYYDKQFENLVAPVYLKGFWQSEKYFLNIKDEIRNSYSFTSLLSSKNTEILKNILSGNSVSVHIRRGDYIDNVDNFKKHGVCDIEYYLKAFRIVESKVENPIYFIFTDDVEWVKKEILPVRKGMLIVEGNVGADSWIDMHLMSRCKHNIIANSTFSWWAAWLNANVRKNVIAPKKWFALDELNQQQFDLIPDSWRQI